VYRLPFFCRLPNGKDWIFSPPKFEHANPQKCPATEGSVLNLSQSPEVFQILLLVNVDWLSIQINKLDLIMFCLDALDQSNRNLDARQQLGDEDMHFSVLALSIETQKCILTSPIHCSMLVNKV
jgi:hypothetical protein